ncbi:hypothetical protein HKD37_10G029408 [Glycine soja]
MGIVFLFSLTRNPLPPFPSDFSLPFLLSISHLLPLSSSLLYPFFGFPYSYESKPATLDVVGGLSSLPTITDEVQFIVPESTLYSKWEEVLVAPEMVMATNKEELINSLESFIMIVSFKLSIEFNHLLLLLILFDILVGMIGPGAVEILVKDLKVFDTFNTWLHYEYVEDKL